MKRILHKILLIEDDIWLAESYSRCLSKFDCKVVTSQHDALDVLNDFTPDVIVADIILDDGLVFDLLSQLQSYDDAHSIPVIICSTISKKYNISDLKSYGVVKIIDKSQVTPDQLSSEIGKIL
jgi:DNA-binding response OmpR family regulator